MADRFEYDVFLSHNSKDKPRVRTLAERLRDAGLKVWLDEWVIRPSDDIYLAIERGLEAARVQVLCMSAAIFLVDVPETSKAIRVNITLPETTLRRIDDHIASVGDHPSP